MRKMSRAEWIAFANAGTRTGKLATTRADGRPHVTPVWFLVDEAGETVYFNTNTTSMKARTLRRDPRFALCVDDQAPPYSFVLIEGDAILSEEPGELLTWATKLGGRYMGADAAEDFGRRNAVPGEYLVRGRITKVVAEAEISS